jgi:hypothetical protein
VSVRGDERLVVEDLVVVGDHAEGHRAVLLKTTLGIRRVEVGPVDGGVRLRDDDRVLRRCDVEDRARDVRTPVRIPGRGRVGADLSGLVVEERDLEERRRLIAPLRTAVEGPPDSAVVEADTGVVLPDEDVARVERIDGDLLAGLGA